VLAARARRARADRPGPTRLFAARLGAGDELAPALAAGALALVLALLGWLSRLRAGPWEPSGADRRRWAVAGALGVWLGLGVVLFSAARTLHPRYLEAFTPAIDGVLGIGLVAAARRLTAGLAPVGRGSRRFDLRWVAVALAAVAVLAGPAGTSLGLVRALRSDSGRPGSLPSAEVARLSAYLRAHTARTRYEFATPMPATAGPLIVRDARPVLVLLRIDHQPLMSTATLRRLVARREVRYAVLGHPCSRRHGHVYSHIPATRWICTHGKDVGHRADIRRGVLFHLRA
jgi:hypothetical protein